MQPPDYKRFMLTAPALCAVLLPLIWAASPAHASSGSIATRDVGGGRIEATVTTASTDCAASGSCNWFAFVVERPPSIPCADDSGFVRNVSPVHTETETETESFIFSPFFPRQTKLCVILASVAPSGSGLVAESTIDLPVGYGQQRSTTKNCSDFKNAAEAQYYLYLYPEDPSRLDPGHIGRACAGVAPCPCDAYRIPAEPPPPAVPAPATTTSSACTGALADQRRARGLLKAARSRHVSHRVLNSRAAALHRAQRRVRSSCPTYY
jgi:hypothetical protein